MSFSVHGAKKKLPLLDSSKSRINFAEQRRLRATKSVQKSLDAFFAKGGPMKPKKPKI